MRTSTDRLKIALGRLFEAVEREPWAWDFYQVLRRVDCLNPDLPRLGTARLPADEAIRLGQDPALTFAPAALSALAANPNGLPPRLDVRFFGLFGPNGALPLYLSEYVFSRLMTPTRDPTLARFADIIHHRFLLLFYRAWAQAQPCVNLDRPAEDRFASYVGALAGIGLRTLRRRDALPDFAKLHHAGLLNRQVRNAEGLGQLIGGFFRLPVRVEQFVGHWLLIEERDHTRIGRARCRLGSAAVLGRRVWDRQHKFRLRIGPLTLAEFTRLLPGGAAIAQLEACVRNYVGLEYAWDAQLLLRADQVPGLQLGRGWRLGYTSWLGERRCRAPADDLVLDVERALDRHRAAGHAAPGTNSNR